MFTTRPEVRGTFGAVASTHWIASAVGMSVLERGGNAFDAAVAAGSVLQIVEPHLNGPGGEVPIILKRHDAPERFSTTTGWPRDRPKGSATARARMSVEPPGAHGTTMVTGRFG